MPLSFLRMAALGCAVALPTTVFAAGGGDDTPPTATSTTKTCTNGMVYSEEAKACVQVESNLLDDDTLYGAVREFAYAGQYDDALGALAAMSDQVDDRVLTYRGFISRKTGDTALANAYYRDAIARNPDNFLARSYYGQGAFEAGDVAAAREQLTEIRKRGGRGTWAEFSLASALRSGTTYNY